MSWQGSSNTVTVNVDGTEKEVESGDSFEEKMNEFINEENINDPIVNYTDGSGVEHNNIDEGEAPDTFENVQSASIDIHKDMA